MGENMRKQEYPLKQQDQTTGIQGALYHIAAAFSFQCCCSSKKNLLDGNTGVRVVKKQSNARKMFLHQCLYFQNSVIVKQFHHQNSISTCFLRKTAASELEAIGDRFSMFCVILLFCLYDFSTDLSLGKVLAQQLHMDNLPNLSNIKVACRIRPPLPQEKQLPISVHNKHTIGIAGHSDVFTLDQIFPQDTNQEQIFNQCAQKGVESVLQGYNSTILAYGQTSSGKTHTMLGTFSGQIIPKTGLIPRCIDYLLKYKFLFCQRQEVEIKCSMIEVYNDDLFDMLKDKKAEKKSMKSNKGISKPLYKIVNNLAQLNSFLAFASKRIVSATNMNSSSSRSHLIVVVNVTKKDIKDLSEVVSQLCLVDLAGSQKYRNTTGERSQVRQGCCINLSLSSLSNVIRSLSEGKLPKYRQSNLTLFLKNSLGGDCITNFLVCISPAIGNEDQTINTLKFSQFARKVTSSASINKKNDSSTLERQLAALEQENTELKKCCYKLMTEGMANAFQQIQMLKTAFKAIEKELRLTRAACTELGKENAWLKKTMEKRVGRKESREKEDG